jgi:uncharacterized protein (TIGR00369 family)
MDHTPDLQRTRSVTWDDPMISAQAATTMSGLAFLQALARGELPVPPIARLLDFQLVEIEEGRVVFTLQPAEFHYNPIGVVQGGVPSAVLDAALGCAVHSTLPAGVAYTTVELHVNLLRPLTRDTGQLRCEAEVIHVGRTVGTAQARLMDSQGKLYSHGTTTCLIFRPEAIR